ncbi:MAG: glycosyltransferase family 4 protein [Cytophagales bacterium]|jgi:glycosyltransferase involved in cell wall biosynthesis|nr:glycosyltransferase family 4 protein [Bacteroidota bacterium]MBS1982438.1 glycosyltransferase family 4 protein [Bacteroidota bacterium]WHZ06294.1 MAG: glycosyltransferase family 4 protein [Cytophagales bacterium]
MKIAIVLNTSWNIYNFRMNFVKTLLDQGHEVHTIAPHDDFTPLLVNAGCHHHDVKMDSRGANPVKDFLLIFELRSIYKAVKPDIILHYTIKPNVYGTLAAASLRIPSINNVCGLGTIFLKKNIVSQVAISLYRLAFRFPKKIFFQNPDDLQLFVTKKLVSVTKTDLLPGSGVDLTRFLPVEFSRNKPFTFLLVSRLITDKGILEYVEAIKKLKSKGIQAKFQILGAKDPVHSRGIKLEVIDEWIQSGTFEYLGTAKDVRPYIQQADCIVLPSYREGTPRTLLEAASSAKPIITTDVPGCHHVVKDGFNGLLCQMKDADDLAEKMEIMAACDDHTLQQMGKNGRHKIETEFDEKIVISKYLSAINHIGA